MRRSDPRSVIVSTILLFAGGLAVPATELVGSTVPSGGDRVTFRVPVSVHFLEQIELDSNGDGVFTRVDSVSVEAANPDIAVEVNASTAPNRVRLERDDDGDPLTPGGSAIPATAAWLLRDYPPMLRVTPDSPLERDTLYRLVIFDGADEEDPAARRWSDGAPASSHEITFQTLPAGASGGVQHEQFLPPSLGFTEDYNIYLPAGHGDSPSQLYPVLYMLHGGWGTYESWNSGGFVEETVNRLVDEGSIEPLIVVMPDGNKGFCGTTFTPWHRLFSNSYDGAYLYGDYTAYDLPDDVEARFRGAPDRRRRGVGGMSMGGFGSASAGLGHPARYSFVAPLAGWEHSVRMESSPAYPECQASHWEVIPDLGDDCFAGQMLQSVIGPPGETDLTHTKSVNGYDLALATADTTFRGAIFLSHGDADTTATVEWSDDISCALEQQGTAHCYKRPPGVGHTGDLWNVAFEEDLLPRFNAIAYWTDLPPGLDGDCVNATLHSPLDADLDGVPGDGDSSGTPGDFPCRDESVDCDDNCRDTPNPDQLDFDADGRGDLCDVDDDGDGLLDATDCDPLDAAAGRPPETGPLMLEGSSVTSITWPAQLTADSYDLSRGSLSNLPAGDWGECLAEGLAQPAYEDPDVPAPGGGFFYLSRGRDAACGGAGPWGTGTAGQERTPAGCAP